MRPVSYILVIVNWWIEDKYRTLKSSSDYNNEKFTAIEKHYIEKSECLKMKVEEIQKEMAIEIEIWENLTEKHDKIRMKKNELENKLLNSENKLNIQEKTITELKLTLDDKEKKLKENKALLSILKDKESNNLIRIEGLERELNNYKSLLNKVENELQYNEKEKLYQIKLVSWEYNKKLNDIGMNLEDFISHISRLESKILVITGEKDILQENYENSQLLSKEQEIKIREMNEKLTQISDEMIQK